MQSMHVMRILAPLQIGDQVVHPRNQDEQLIRLSKQVTDLQFKLSLALLKLEHRPLQPQPSANDNDAGDLVA
jgi:hypothetical protein